MSAEERKKVIKVSPKYYFMAVLVGQRSNK